MPSALRPLLASILFAVALGAHAFTGVVFFGDSLSDTGNDTDYLDIIIAPTGFWVPLRTELPISEAVFRDGPDFPYPSQRFSNGPVWTEYFATSLNLPVTASRRQGNSYAFGGARTFVRGPLAKGFPFSVKDQVKTFLEANQGQAPGSALYVLECGANDAQEFLDTPTQDGNVSEWAARVANLVLQLHQAGAQHILLWNIPDLGKTPAYLARGPAASQAASRLVKAMNDTLAASLQRLAPQAPLHLYQFDAFRLLSEPAPAGFTNMTDACALDAQCIRRPEGYFFWDGIHPTTQGHAYLSRKALEAVRQAGDPPWQLGNRDF